MKLLGWLFIFIYCFHLQLFAKEDPQPNILPYGQGTVQISTSVNANDTVLPKVPFKASVMITHDSNQEVDPNSFRFGDNPIKATFMQSVNMSVTSKLQVTIYQVELPGLAEGNQTLPPISVKVAGKYYQAPPLQLIIGE